jgi:predicted enzyme related to lactoylglutathione lyase
MISVSVSVDVPILEDGIRFYGQAFGFEKVAEPYPGVAVLRVEGAQLHYDRHWTPVHIDIHVDEFKSALARAINAGAIQEQLFEVPGRPAVAFCCDPFGHGFCLIENRKS